VLRRLGFKLSLSLTIIVVVIAAISGYISWRSQERQLLRTMVLGADQLSKSVASATWHAMLADDRDSAYQIMRTIAEKQGIDRIRMFNHAGHLAFSTNAAERPATTAVDKEYCAPCHQGGQRRSRFDVNDRVRFAATPDGRPTLNMVTPIYNETSCQAACHAHPANLRVLGVLDVGLRLDVLDQEAAEVKMHLAVVTVLQILLTAALIVLLIRRFVGMPIQELIQGTKAVSEMDLDKPISILHKSQELDELEVSFNRMRERLRTALAEINEFTNRLEVRVNERTEQLKAAQKKLLHSDRLASLGQLAASVAHEINNPVSGVLNLSMLLERIMTNGQTPPGREEECKRYLARITAETARIGRIVSDLLAFSRRSKPQRSQSDLNKIVNTTVSLVRHKLKLNDTEVQLELAPDLPTIFGDGSQLQQVVLNLVLNAAEATGSKGGGMVWVETRSVQDGAAVELIIRDNGEGIPPENLTKIFDPFFTTKPEGKGVGLGLAVSYGIVQAHDGDVEVKSAPGQGTTFTITLPVKPAANAPEPVPEVIGAGGAG
jgi:two-component system NtrC family sensor kinase